MYLPQTPSLILSCLASKSVVVSIASFVYDTYRQTPMIHLFCKLHIISSYTLHLPCMVNHHADHVVQTCTAQVRQAVVLLSSSLIIPIEIGQTSLSPVQST